MFVPLSCPGGGGKQKPLLNTAATSKLNIYTTLQKKKRNYAHYSVLILKYKKHVKSDKFNLIFTLFKEKKKTRKSSHLSVVL